MSTHAQTQERLVDHAHSFGLMLADKGIDNIGKWGLQDLATLGLAIAEEAGEVARAILENAHAGKPVARAYEEAVDLGALCVQMMLLVREQGDACRKD
jgi:NTP pyrophosphatase (non-canonical NTP hydrolase)